MQLLLFACAALLSIWLTFGSLGPLLSHIMENGIVWWTALLDRTLQGAGCTPMLHDLMICGICTGVGSVLSFVPTIAVLFFCLSCWESSGVLTMLSRALDRPMRRLGLSGDCAMPLLLGFGCAVPAIMQAEQLPTRKEKRLTIFLIPFLSCSAKLPLYTLLAAAFFGEQQFLLIAGLYLSGILLGFALLRLRTQLLSHRSEPACRAHCAHCTHSIASTSKSTPQAATRLRLPDLPAACAQAWTNSSAYMQKIFTIVLLASSVIWALEHLTPAFTQTTAPQQSMLASIGRTIAPLFAPLGFGDWRAAAALLTGLSAKEAIVSTLAVLADAQTPPQAAGNMLTQMLTPLSALSFAVFSLLYMPCIATFAAVKKALGGLRPALAMLFTQTMIAWLAACFLWQAGSYILRFCS